MVKFLKRTIAALLALTTAMALVACDGGNKENESSSEHTSSISTEATTMATSSSSTEGSSSNNMTSSRPVLKQFTTAAGGGNYVMYYDFNGLVEKITFRDEVYKVDYEVDKNLFPTKVSYPLSSGEYIDINFALTFDNGKVTAVRFIFDQKLKQKIDESDEAADQVHNDITNIMDNYTHYVGFNNAELTNNIDGNKYIMKNGIDVYKIYNLSASSRTEAFKNDKGWLTKLNTMNEGVYQYDEMGKMTEMNVNGIVTKINYTKTVENGFDVYTNDVTFMPMKYYIANGHIARVVEGTEATSLVDTEYNQYFQPTQITNVYDGNAFSNLIYEYYK